MEKHVRKRIVFLIVFLGIMIMNGCSEDKQNHQENLESAKIENVDISSNTKEEKSIPRIVNLSPPIYSMFQLFDNKDYLMVGQTPGAVKNANRDIVQLVSPEYKNINTSFVGQGSQLNKESLMKLKPEIVFYYGKLQEKGLENINVPLVNTHLKTFDSQKITINWEKQIADSIKIQNKEIMKSEWDKTNKIIEKNKDLVPKMRALYIFSNAKGEVMISTGASYGDYFMTCVGLENVAKDKKASSRGAGQLQVNMEQISKWNPDIIFVNMGLPAKAYLNNEIQGQNWSIIKAVKDKKVFDIPKGIFSWGMPCADSPLMPRWILSKIIPSEVSPEEFRESVSKYYEAHYNTKLNENALDSILLPRRTFKKQ